MKLRTINAELLRYIPCPYCLEPLSVDNIELTKTGMIVCQNTTGDNFLTEFGAPCGKKFSLTYCGGCKKVGLTERMKFHIRKLVGSRSEVRCHVCQNGKLSSVLERAIPHTKQVVIDGGGKVIIKPPENPEDTMGELVNMWNKNSQFTPDMIGKGEVDRSNLTVIPKQFWKSDIPLTGYDEPLSEPYCSRCSEILMKLSDGSMVTDYSHVCPKCGVYFRVISSPTLPQHYCDNCNERLTKLPQSVFNRIDYTHVCPQCDEFFRFIDAGGQEPHSGTTNAPLPQA